MANESNASEGTVRKVVKGMLNMCPYKLQKRHGLTYAQKKARVKKCKRLLDRAANGEHLRMLFTDEKLFTIEQSYNSQNVRVLAVRLMKLIRPEELFPEAWSQPPS
ncbi:hypothetical protein ANCDUO_27449 [Ancylostoma duodenale]|uniref:Uncharacterized protein n=1 Tax=Ancylostoma duodenale TaxID=51022 RepID=A0A0C2FBY3_9BILA|nr:hypothetical protein ANCDUO_27449 [Ancylostoma duodenale]